MCIVFVSLCVLNLFALFLVGNVHVYRNGMHFAHHNRQERREQQRDVSLVYNASFRLEFHACLEPDLLCTVINCCCFVFFVDREVWLCLSN